MPDSGAEARKSTYADRETPLIENAWYVAGLSEEVSRALKERRILGRSLLLYRTQAGAPVALDNRCLHRSFPLSKGYLEGDNVVCGYHGLTYDPGGACVRIPALQQQPTGVTLRRYAVVERAPLIWVWMGDPAAADEAMIPEYFSPATEGWAPANGYYHIQANYVGLHENLVDLTHFQFLHKDIGIGTDAFVQTKLETTVDGTRVRAALRTLNSPPPPAYVRALGLGDDERVDRISEFGFVAPGVSAGLLTLRRLGAPADGRLEYRQHTLHFVTPETQDTTHYFWFVVRDFHIDSPAFTAATQAATERAFQEDKDALEWVQDLVSHDPRADFRELSFTSDRAGLQTRKILQHFADLEREK